MSAYTEEVLIDKLNKLNNTQQSIQTLSHWVMYHKKRCVQSVRVWDREIIKAPKERKLTYLYLANDIMQTSRKKGGEFIKEFSKALPNCIQHVHRESDFEDKKAINRLLSIWEERKVFPADFVEGIRKSLKGTSGVTEGLAAVPLELSVTAPVQSNSKGIPVVNLIREIDASEIKLELVADKLPSVRQSLVSGELLRACTNQHDVSELAIELQEGISIFENYQQALENDIHVRSKLISVLHEYLKTQETQLAASQNKLQDCRQQLDQTEQLKVKLKDLYESLPPPQQENMNLGTPPRQQVDFDQQPQVTSRQSHKRPPEYQEAPASEDPAKRNKPNSPQLLPLHALPSLNILPVLPPLDISSQNLLHQNIHFPHQNVLPQNPNNIMHVQHNPQHGPNNSSMHNAHNVNTQNVPVQNAPIQNNQGFPQNNSFSGHAQNSNNNMRYGQPQQHQLPFNGNNMNNMNGMLDMNAQLGSDLVLQRSIQMTDSLQMQNGWTPIPPYRQ